LCDLWARNVDGLANSSGTDFWKTQLEIVLAGQKTRVTAKKVWPAARGQAVKLRRSHDLCSTPRGVKTRSVSLVVSASRRH
jgi:hypothetical protein